MKMVKSGMFFVSEKGERDNRFDLILLLLLHRSNFHFETLVLITQKDMELCLG